MSWTKREIIKQAFTEPGLASYAFDLSAEEMQDAMRILDAMMGFWISLGIVFDPAYPIPSTIADGNLDSDTNAPSGAVEPMYTNLAVRIASGFGKSVMPGTRSRALTGYNTLLGQSLTIPEVSMDGGIKGAGAKTPNSPFFNGSS